MKSLDQVNHPADRVQEFAQIYHAKLLKDSGMEIICVDGKAERGTVLENGCNRSRNMTIVELRCGCLNFIPAFQLSIQP